MRQRLLLAGCLLLILAGCQVKAISTPAPSLAPITRIPSATVEHPVSQSDQTSTPGAPTGVDQSPSFGKGPVVDIAWADNGDSLSILTPTGLSVHDARTLAPRSTTTFPQVHNIKLFFAPHPDTIFFESYVQDDSGDHVGTWSETQKQYQTQITIRNTYIADGSPGPTQIFSASPDGRLLSVVSENRPDIYHESGQVDIWSLRTGEVVRSIYTSTPNELFTAAIFSPDSRWLAVGGTDSLIYLVDLDANEAPRHLAGNTATIRYLVFSPDSSTLYSGGVDASVRAWSIPDGQELQTLRGFKTDVEQVAVSPDGSYLAASDEIGDIQLWGLKANLAVGDPQTIQSEGPPIYKLAFHPQGDRLAAILADTVAVWDLTARAWIATAEPVRTASVPTSTGQPALSPSPSPTPSATPWSTGEVTPIAVGTPAPGAIQVKNADQLAVTSRLGNGTAEDMAWSPDGKTVAVAGSLGVTLYDADTWIELGPVSSGIKVTNLVFSPDGKSLATGAGEGKIEIWDLTSRKLLNGYSIEPFYSMALCFHPNGDEVLYHISTYANGTYDKEEMVSINIATGAKGPVLYGFFGDLCAISPDGNFILGDASWGLVRIWSIQTGEVIYTFPKRSTNLTGIDWSRDGKTVALAYSSGSIQVWDVAQIGTPQLARSFQAGEVDLTLFEPDYVDPSVQFSPDGRTLASTGKDNLLRIWEVGSGKLLSQTVGGASSPVFAPDGQSIAAISVGSEIHVWSVGSTGSPVLSKTLISFAGPVNSLSFSQDGSTVVTSDGTSFSTWSFGPAVPQARVLAIILEPGRHAGNVMTFNLVRNQLIAGLWGGAVQVWDAPSNKLLIEFQASMDGFGKNGSPYIRYVKISPDGNWLITDGAIGDLKMWNTQTWEQVSTFILGVGVYESTFSPDSRLIAWVERDYAAGPGMVTVFDFHTGKTLARFQNGGELAFSADGLSLFVERSRVDLSSGEVVQTYSSSSTVPVKALAVSSSGDLLIIGRGDGVIELWDVAQGRLVNTLSSGTQAITTLTFSRDGRSLAAGNADGTIWVWGATGK